MGVLLEAIALQRLADLCEDLFIGHVRWSSPELADEEGREGAAMERLGAALGREKRVHRGLVGLGGRQLEDRGAPGVESRLVLLARQGPPGHALGLLHRVDVSGQLPRPRKGRYIPRSGTGRAVVEDDHDVVGGKGVQPLAELVVADVESRRGGTDVRGCEGLVEPVVFVPAFVPHLGAVARVEDDHVVSRAHTRWKPFRERALDSRTRRLLVEEHKDIALGEGVLGQQDVSYGPGVVLGARKVTPDLVVVVDVVTDADDHRPMRGGGALSGAESQQGQGGDRSRGRCEPSHAKSPRSGSRDLRRRHRPRDSNPETRPGPAAAARSPRGPSRPSRAHGGRRGASSHRPRGPARRLD